MDSGTVIATPLNKTLQKHAHEILEHERGPIIGLAIPKTSWNFGGHGSRSQNSDVLTSAMRISLSWVIAQSIYGERAELSIVFLDTDLEQILLKSLELHINGGLIA